MQRVFSGVQPSGVLHIGNYLGALSQWISLQEQHRCLFSIVDLHAITAQQDPKVLRENILKTAALYLAVGIDPDQSILFVQSDVKEHAELSWILNTITKISELKLMHQFKEKSKSQSQNINMGLFGYPVLMAADILLYKSTLVPVGEDQKQHVELTRELARRFNSLFGETFVIPEASVPKSGARIMGLDDPTKKMQKSARSVYNYIALTDSPEEIKRKISRAVTDSGNEIVFGEDKPALSNLLTIYHLFSGLSVKEIEKKYYEKGYKDFKGDLGSLLIDKLGDIQKKYASYMKHEDHLSATLKKGAHAARTIAEQTITEVKAALGLGGSTPLT